MRITKKVYGRFFEISGLILGAAALLVTIVWAVAKGETLGEVTGCVNLQCLLFFGTKVTLGLFVISWLIISLVTVSVDLVSLGIKTGVQKFHKYRELSRVMTLTKVEPYDNRYELRIHNNEDSFIVLKEVLVFDRNGTRSRVSVRPNVQVESGSSQTTTFIAEDVKSEHPHFFIIGHTNGVSYKTDYRIGIHKFDIAINYDSDEKNFQGSIKRFRVIVNHKARHDLEIHIEDPDKK